MIDVAAPATRRWTSIPRDRFVDKAAGSRKRLVRIYGEMVDVLWSSGREDAALSLEILWHQLIAGRKCSLLCGYSSGVCPGEGFNTICDRHSHVVPLHTAG